LSTSPDSFDNRRRWAASNEVEAQLRSMISKLSGMPIIQRPSPAAPPIHGSILGNVSPETGRDKLDDIADILRAEGKPLHITVIAERLSKVLGTEVLRTDIEPGMNRHGQSAASQTAQEAQDRQPRWPLAGAFIAPCHDPA
jgi:hypothetical protein